MALLLLEINWEIVMDVLRVTEREVATALLLMEMNWEIVMALLLMEMKWACQSGFSKETRKVQMTARRLTANALRTS